MSVADSQACPDKQVIVKGKKVVISHVKRAGPLLLGPQLATSPVKCVTQCLARRDKTDDFYTVKILTLPGAGEGETTDDIQGRILIHTEYNLLKKLQGQKGVIKQHGIYKDIAEEEVEIGGRGYSTGRTQTRMCLILQCYMPHDYSPRYANLVNLQQLIIKEKRLQESMAVKIFYNVVEVVNRLHKQNVVHRDLKLGNIIMDKNTNEVTLTNFGLGRHLTDENEQLRDQRGSPAYISPDVISGKPYLGKPSDMWALGVVLYTMLYGQFPFYDSSPSELFRKIKLADFTIPMEFNVSQPTVKLIQSLLVLDPKARLTASATLEKLEEIIRAGEAFLIDSDFQVVPEFDLGLGDDEEYQPRSKVIRQPASATFPEANLGEMEMILASLAPPSSPPEENNIVPQLKHKSFVKQQDPPPTATQTTTASTNEVLGIIVAGDDSQTNAVRRKIVARRRRNQGYAFAAAAAKKRYQLGLGRPQFMRQKSLGVEDVSE